MRIKKKLILLLGVIAVLMLILAGFMVWNSIQIRREVSVVKEAVRSLQQMSEIRSNYHKQTHLLLHFFVYGEEDAKKDFETLGASVRRELPYSQQVLSSKGAAKNSEAPEKNVEDLVERYDAFMAIAEKAFRLKQAGKTTEALALLKHGTVPRVSDQVFSSLDEHIDVNIQKIETAYHNILMRLGGMPWHYTEGHREVERAQSTVRYFLAVDRSSQIINRQMNELMNYLWNGDAESRNRSLELGWEARRGFVDWGKVIKRQILLGVGGEEADLSVLLSIKSRYHDAEQQTVRAIALRDQGKTLEALRYLEGRMSFHIDNSLLSTLDAAGYDARQEIEEAHNALLASAQAAGITAVVALGLFSLALFALFFNLIRGMLASLVLLREGTERIGRGEAGYQVTMNAHDELGELASSFNRMSVEMAKSRTVIKRRLELEEAVSTISSRFVGVIDIDKSIRAAIADLGELSGAGRSYLFLMHEDGSAFRYAYEWCAPGVGSASDSAAELPVGAFPWWVRKLTDLEVINVRNVSAMPPEAENEKQELTRRGVKAVLALPVTNRGKLIGFAGFDNVAAEWEWSDDDLMLLRMFAELIGGALERKDAEDKLRRYADEVKEASEELKSFAYIVSHDLRAPLVSIKGFSAELQLTLQEFASAFESGATRLDEQRVAHLAGLLRKDVPEALNFISSSVVRMDSLISSVLTLSRLGRRELKPERIDMNGLARGILDSLAHQIADRRVKVTVGSLPEISADKLSLEQIFGNLLDNAIKYLDPERQGEIEIIAEARARENVFRVRDNGRGIAREDIPKAFEVFRRVGKQDTPGEGMGLPYVKALVKRHGGRIWCESEAGKGSVFSFTIKQQVMGDGG